MGPVDVRRLAVGVDDEGEPGVQPLPTARTRELLDVYCPPERKSKNVLFTPRD